MATKTVCDRCEKTVSGSYTLELKYKGPLMIGGAGLTFDGPAYPCESFRSRRTKIDLCRACATKVLTKTAAMLREKDDDLGDQ